LKQHPSAIDKVADTFYLSEGEKRLLLAAGVGEGLFFAGSNHVAIKVIASDAEHRLITTNPEEILKLKEEGLIKPRATTNKPQYRQVENMDPNKYSTFDRAGQVKPEFTPQMNKPTGFAPSSTGGTGETTIAPSAPVQTQPQPSAPAPVAPQAPQSSQTPAATPSPAPSPSSDTTIAPKSEETSDKQPSAEEILKSVQDVIGPMVANPNLQTGTPPAPQPMSQPSIPTSSGPLGQVPNGGNNNKDNGDLV